MYGTEQTIPPPHLQQQTGHQLRQLLDLEDFKSQKNPKTFEQTEKWLKQIHCNMEEKVESISDNIMAIQSLAVHKMLHFLRHNNAYLSRRPSTTTTTRANESIDENLSVDDFFDVLTEIIKSSVRGGGAAITTTTTTTTTTTITTITTTTTTTTTTLCTQKYQHQEEEEEEEVPSSIESEISEESHDVTFDLGSIIPTPLPPQDAFLEGTIAAWMCLVSFISEQKFDQGFPEFYEMFQKLVLCHKNEFIKIVSTEAIITLSDLNERLPLDQQYDMEIQEVVDMLYRMYNNKDDTIQKKPSRKIWLNLAKALEADKCIVELPFITPPSSNLHNSPSMNFHLNINKKGTVCPNWSEAMTVRFIKNVIGDQFHQLMQTQSFSSSLYSLMSLKDNLHLQKPLSMFSLSLKIEETQTNYHHYPLPYRSSSFSSSSSSSSSFSTSPTHSLINKGIHFGSETWEKSKYITTTAL